MTAQEVITKTAWFLLAITIILIGVGPIGGKEYLVSEINRIQVEPPKTIPTSCTFDAQVLCDPTVHPLQSLLDEDPYVRMIMVTPLASVSPDSSMEILENLFTEPGNTRHPSPPTYEQEDAAIGAMLEEMMTSAVRFSVAAEDATSSAYYGTTESAAEEAFVAMLTSLMDLSRQSSGAAEYYHHPNQLSEKLCSYGKTVLENESMNDSGPMVVGDDMTRLRLARRLSEVETAPEAPGMFINGDEPEMMFISSFRMIVLDGPTAYFSPAADSSPQDDGLQKCLWSAYRTREVSYSCNRALNEFQESKKPILLKHFATLDTISYATFYFPVNVGILAALGMIALLFCCNDDEEDDEEYLGNEYIEISDSININRAYMAVPLRVV